MKQNTHWSDESQNGSGNVDTSFTGTVTVGVTIPFDNSQVSTFTLAAVAGVASLAR